jgi:hypothetical protein
MSDDLTREEISKVMEAMPEDATTVGIAEIIYNIIDGFNLDEGEFMLVMSMVVAARHGSISVKGFGPDGERDSHGTH